MVQEIRIGVFAGDEAADGWVRVLRQDRLPWDRVEGPDRPIIVFDGALPSWCGTFVERGGVAIVTGAPRADALFGPSVIATLTRFRPPARDREAALPCLARVFEGSGAGEIRLHENRKARGGNLADVRAAVLTRAHGQGWLIFTGLPLATHLGAVGDSLRTFTEASNVTERVADRRQGRTRRHHDLDARAGLRQARPALCPHRALPERGAPRCSCSASTSMACSAPTAARSPKWRTPMGSEARSTSTRLWATMYPGDLSRDWLATTKIAHHADVHDLFDTAEQNVANLQGGMDWVEQHLGVRTTGYVAPRGLWNHALDQAMASLGHVYSSDFGLDFDSLPFFTHAGVLQIPVHPFSPERFAVHQEDAGLGPPSSRAVLHHFLTALDRQAALRRPAHLYGHPEVLGRMAHEVLPPLFQAVARLGLPNMTVADFAALVDRSGPDET